jgi:hypothetical protein
MGCLATDGHGFNTDEFEQGLSSNRYGKEVNRRKRREQRIGFKTRWKLSVNSVAYCTTKGVLDCCFTEGNEETKVAVS